MQNSRRFCSLQQFYSDGCCFIKKKFIFLFLARKAFFLARMLEKKCIYLCTAKHEIFQKPLHTSETLKPHFPYMYVPNIIFEILLYNIKNFYEFELDNKSKRIYLVISPYFLKYTFTLPALYIFNY